MGGRQGLRAMSRMDNLVTKGAACCGARARACKKGRLICLVTTCATEEAARERQMHARAAEAVWGKSVGDSGLPPSERRCQGQRAGGLSPHSKNQKREKTRRKRARSP